MTPTIFVVAAARKVDGQGSLEDVHDALKRLSQDGARLGKLVIDPLSAGWDSLIKSGHFRSGCGPIEAVARARELIDGGEVDAVLIHGQDHLRSGYPEGKESRQQLMAIYGPHSPLPHAYTLLAHAFMRRHGISATEFRALADALFANYSRTAAHWGHRPPKPEAMRMVTHLFRAVDCANPVVDFSGAIILGSARWAPPGKRLALLGVGLGRTADDGPDHVEHLASYEHLGEACRIACDQAGVDLAKAFKARQALIEAYTCFPVAPLGFLLASGIVSGVDEIEPLLSTHEITVTGGMNLARAAWNNPALNAMIALFDRLDDGDARTGAVHGNGGLGYRQGLAIFGLE